MKKTIVLFLACITFCISGCYDDSAVWESIKDHEGRIKELELLCGKINENISSLQKIVQSLENKDYITSITPIKENGKDIGYTIKFSKSGDVTIYHGKEGATGTTGEIGATGPAGHSPEIGAKADADGVYYWTIDGEWMRDEDGNLIPTTGKDGEEGEAGNNGVTPQLKIEDGYWFVSYNNGELWDKLSEATNDSAYCVFSDVVYTTTEVKFYLAEGESFSFPLVTSMTIKFEEKEYVVNNAEGESIEFVVEGANEDVDLEFMVDDEEWDISVAMTSSDKGVLTVVPATKKSSAKVMIFAQSGNQFDMCSLILKRTTVPIATIEEIGYNHFDVKICVPESVKESGNIIRYIWGDLFMFNWRGNNYEQMLLLNGGEINTTDTDIYRTIKETVKYDYETEEYNTIIEPLVPGQPMVFLAAEFTPYGDMVGEPEIIRFKTKEPAVSNSKVNVTFDNVLSYDADILFEPEENIEFYLYLILDEYSYNTVLRNHLDNDETLMQWFTTSYTGMYNYGIGMTSGASLAKLSSVFISAPEADSEYHVFVVGMENEKGTVQSYDHYTVKTAKKLRANGPQISITHVPELSSSNSVAVNFRCTSVYDSNSGPAVTGKYAYEYVHNWLIANNSGWSDYELINEGGIEFSGEEITRMNSLEGCIINIPTVDGMSLRIGAFAKNDEYTLCNTIPTIDVTTDFFKRNTVNSEYLTTDILEGEWVMTAQTGRNGQHLETTVNIIRGYQEGRDYPSECPAEFKEQVEIFNQKRLIDKNCLLLVGWFDIYDYWWDSRRSPYDLLIDNPYAVYDYQQLFFDAGPKMFIEVDSTGKLRINSGREYLPASAWYEPAYYMGYSPNSEIGLGYNYIDFEINVSNDKNTLTINPTDGHYLNLVRSSDNRHIDIRSAITLTRRTFETR